jgi:hypothetical protein
MKFGRKITAISIMLLSTQVFPTTCAKSQKSLSKDLQDAARIPNERKVEKKREIEKAAAERRTNILNELVAWMKANPRQRISLTSNNALAKRVAKYLGPRHIVDWMLMDTEEGWAF